MARERPMSLLTIIALALATGAALGLLVGRLWAHEIPAPLGRAAT